MRPVTLEWVAKAERDLECVRRELRARRAPNYDAACFHAQQCAEKYLKALLQEHSAPFPKTHDVVVLIDLCVPFQPEWSAFRGTWGALTDYAVRYRCPGEAADREGARASLRLCRDVRSHVREALGLSD